MRSEANSLYEWVQPALPEDLIFYKDRQEPMFVTISHEQDAFMVANKDEIINGALESPFAVAHPWRL